MSSLFPEQPILFYPSLASRLGAEEAILLAVYYQYACHHGGQNVQGAHEFVLRRREWLGLTPFFDEDKLAQLTSSLVDQGVLDALFLPNGNIRVAVLDSTTPDQEPDRSETVAEPAQPEGPNEQICSALKQVAVDASVQSSSFPVAYPGTLANQAVAENYQPVQHPVVRGPAPSFGGSTGWARPKDDLELLFEKQELHHQQLKEITPDWQPHQDTLQLLLRKNITEEFSAGCTDQFVAYYMGQGQRKKSWEQPFMKWVMREWVDTQKRQYRERATNDQQGLSGERDQARTRQDKRERITSAVMDINNIDWI